MPPGILYTGDAAMGASAAMRSRSQITNSRSPLRGRWGIELISDLISAAIKVYYRLRPVLEPVAAGCTTI